MTATERLRTKETDTPTAYTAVCIPPIEVSNDEIVAFLADSNIQHTDKKPFTTDDIEGRTGIVQRQYWAKMGELLDRKVIVPEKGTEAAIRAVEGRPDWDGHIDFLFATTGIPYKESLSARIAENLKREGIDVASVQPDVYAECSSPVWILNHIRENPDKFEGKNILIVSSEYGSPIVDDINKTLVADGASAIAFTNGKDLQILGSSMLHDLEERDLIKVSIKKDYVPSEGSLVLCEVDQPSAKKKLSGEEEFGLELQFGEMNGPKVFKWCLRPTTLRQVFAEACEMAGVTGSEIDWVIPHQANGRLIDIMGGLFGLGQDKIISIIKETGNSGSNTTIRAMHMAIEQGLIKKGSTGVFVGFGAGMMAGAVVAKIG